MDICFIVPVLLMCNSICFVELLHWRNT